MSWVTRHDVGASTDTAAGPSHLGDKPCLLRDVSVFLSEHGDETLFWVVSPRRTRPLLGVADARKPLSAPAAGRKERLRILIEASGFWYAVRLFTINRRVISWLRPMKSGPTIARSTESGVEL